jgi:hypothetical protein
MRHIYISIIFILLLSCKGKDTTTPTVDSLTNTPQAEKVITYPPDDAAYDSTIYIGYVTTLMKQMRCIQIYTSKKVCHKILQQHLIP